MELPPQRPLRRIPEPTFINRTLPTTKQQQQQMYLSIKITKLKRRFESLTEEFDDNSRFTSTALAAIDERLDRLEKKKSQSLIGNIENSLSQLSTANFEELSQDDEPLNFDERFEQLNEKIESLKYFFNDSIEEEAPAKLRQSLTIATIQDNITELTDDVAALKAKINSLITNDFKTLKEDLKLHETSTDDELVKITKDLLKLQKTDKQFSMLEDSISSNEKTIPHENFNQNKKTLLNPTEQQETYDTLINVFSEINVKTQERIEKLEADATSTQKKIATLMQQQSISTLRRWLTFLGGGSTLALIFLLWHHAHKQ